MEWFTICVTNLHDEPFTGNTHNFLHARVDTNNRRYFQIHARDDGAVVVSGDTVTSNFSVEFHATSQTHRVRITPHRFLGDRFGNLLLSCVATASCVTSRENTPTSEETERAPVGGSSVISGIIVAVVLLVIIAVALGVGYMFWRKRKRSTKIRETNARATTHNNTYAETDDVRVSVSSPVGCTSDYTYITKTEGNRTVTIRDGTEYDYATTSTAATQHLNRIAKENHNISNETGDECENFDITNASKTDESKVTGTQRTLSEGGMIENDLYQGYDSNDYQGPAVSENSGAMAEHDFYKGSCNA